jgi:hypothetical protein
MAWLALLIAPGTLAREAGDDSHPYRAIVARNAFRLKDPVPPPPPPTNALPVAEVPKIDVKLTGVALVNGVRRAYLMVPDAEHPGQFEFTSLTDDPQRGGGVRHRSGLEIREINLEDGSVRLVNGGIETTINVEDNGVTAAPAPTTTAAVRPGTVPQPNQPGRVNVRRPSVVVTPTVSNPPTAQAADASPALSEPLIFSRNRARAQAFDTRGQAADDAALRVWNANTGNRITTPDQNIVMPTRPIRTDVEAPPPAQAETPPIPVAQQYEVLIRQRLAADSVGVPLPPIPGLPETPPPQQ